MPGSCDIVGNDKVRQYITDLRGPSDDERSTFDVYAEVAVGDLPKTLIPDYQLQADEVLFLEGFSMIYKSGSAWTSGTNLKIQDTGATYDLVTVLTANLPSASSGVGTSPGGAKGTFSTDNAGFAKGNPVGTGLKLVQTGTYSGAAVLAVRVWGSIRKLTAETLS